jgi:hypothetical protein
MPVSFKYVFYARKDRLFGIFIIPEFNFSRSYLLLIMTWMNAKNLV